MTSLILIALWGFLVRSGLARAGDEIGALLNAVELEELGCHSAEGKDCLYEVISNYAGQCDRIDVMNSMQRSKIAIEMSQCVLNNDSTLLPQQCTGTLSTQSQVQACVSLLSDSAVTWTTYFGYLNILPSICQYYREPLETERTLDRFRRLGDILEQMLDLAEPLLGGELEKKLRSRMEEITEAIAHNATVKVDQMLDRMAKQSKKWQFYQQREWAQVELRTNETAKIIGSRLAGLDRIAAESINRTALNSIKWLQEAIRKEQEQLHTALIKDEESLVQQVHGRHDALLRSYDVDLRQVKNELKETTESLLSSSSLLVGYTHHTSGFVHTVWTCVLTLVALTASYFWGSLGLRLPVTLAATFSGVYFGLKTGDIILP